MKSAIKLFIKPNDVLFFRDGRPFEAGKDNTARMVFPPAPTTFYGAIRTVIMSQFGVDFAELKNSKILDSRFDEIALESEKRTLAISDFGLARKNGNTVERFFPVPSDIVKEVLKDKFNDERFFILSPNGKNNIKINFPTDSLLPLSINPPIFPNDPIVENCNEYFISEKGINLYIENNKLDETHFIKKEEIFLSENRVGIRKDNTTNSSQDGFLFSLEYAYLNKKYNDIENIEFGFYLEVNSKLLKHNNESIQSLKLGGMSRSAFFEKVENVNTISQPNSISNRFKMTLITPAIFNNGWIPDGVEKTNENGKDVFVGEINGIKVKLVSAAVDRYIGIGGWDLLSGKQKPLKRAVPAGSVYFFESLEGNDFNKDTLNENIISKSIMKDNSLRKEGLGLTIIGVW